jgi:hypothetical protein
MPTHRIYEGKGMREQLAARLQELQAEFASGQKMLADLEAKQVELRNTLLRISGAIQVLEEELAKATQSASEDGAQCDSTDKLALATSARGM